MFEGPEVGSVNKKVFGNFRSGVWKNVGHQVKYEFVIEKWCFSLINLEHKMIGGLCREYLFGRGQQVKL